MAIDWTKIFQQYKGLWVALKDDEKIVIASGKTAKEAWSKAKEAGFARPILTKMPAKILPYVGYGA